MSYLPTVTLSFDVPWSTVITNALPVMTTNGLIGTVYVNTLAGYLNSGAPYATTAQVASLASAGWEIGVYSGTISTRNMVDALTYSGESAVLTQLTNSKNGVIALGYAPTSLAPNQHRWDDYRLRVLAGMLGFNSVRATGDVVNVQQYPIPDKLYVYGGGCASLTNTDTDTTVKAKIDSLLITGGWLNIGMHGVANGGDVYHVPLTVFTTLCEYIKAKQDLGLLRCVTFTQGLTPSGTPPEVPPMANPTNTVGIPTMKDLLE